jgi:hypothetical protein
VIHDRYNAATMARQTLDLYRRVVDDFSKPIAPSKLEFTP